MGHLTKIIIVLIYISYLYLIFFILKSIIFENYENNVKNNVRFII